MMETLSGLVARHAQKTGTGEYLWTGLTSNPSYEEWFRRLVAWTKPRVIDGTYSVWDLVDRYRKAGVVKGYILYQYDHTNRAWHGNPEPAQLDTSANVATTLAGLLSGIAVDESLRGKAEAAGLRMLADVREWDEARCLKEYGDRCSRDLLSMNDPKNFLTRSLAVAARAFVASRANATYDQALARLRPGVPVLGWGIGDEAQLTLPSSRWGAFQTATNWCANLPVLSAGKTGLDYPLKRLRPNHRRVRLSDLDWDDRSRFVSFVLSDGDNVQWLMLNFCLGSSAQQYWACPERGSMPFGWTIPLMDLAQLCPYTLEYLRDTATDRDDFVLLSGGYYYPDEFGIQRTGTDLMAGHAARIGRYMKAGGVRTLMVNNQHWDSPRALKSYGDYAREIPGLLGVLAVQYDDYTGGSGKVLWVKAKGRRTEVPVVSARFALWAQARRPRHGGPARMAGLINEWAGSLVTKPEDRFCWIVDHCWSWFRRTQPGEPLDSEEVEQQESDRPDVSRGYRPAEWAAGSLEPSVRVVTPEELLLRLRLASRPEQTLRDWLAALQRSSAVAGSLGHQLTEAEHALYEMEHGRASVAEAFELLKRAEVSMDRAGRRGRT
ncbi:MAG: hypothetical protein HY318_02985 [Armatimonadetes bacterium]|nr:hypothetical protein [Armatimonadota bacterium]